MDYNPDCPAWGNLTWPKVGEFNLANGEPELVAIQNAFDACYMQMMTKMVQGCLPDDTESAQAVGTIAFSNDGIDFAWEAPRVPFP